MAKDVGDVIGTAVGRVAREGAKTVSENAKKAADGPLSGMKGLAAGAGLALLVPVATKGAGKLVKSVGDGAGSPVKKVGDKLGGGVKDAVGSKIDEAGGAAGMAKEAGKGLLPGGGDGGGSNDSPGVGKGRRMPVQQAIDVAVPIETVYNQFTQFEDWPEFMHRVTRVTQEDETNVSFATKIWTRTREFKAEIITQRPNERIKWRVSEGITHTGVVTFHELAPRLTRIEVTMDVEPGGMIEKAARGMRHVKRAVRADLHRFKAYIEMEEEETGAWRGEIDDGEVKSKSSSSGAGSRSSSSKKSRSRSASSRSRSSSNGKSSSSGTRSRSSSRRTKASSSGSGSKSSSSRKKSGSRS